MDVQLISPNVLVRQVDPSNDTQLFPITLLFRDDAISQEVNETFTLTINFNERFLGVLPRPTIRHIMVGSVQDNDSEWKVYTLSKIA